MGILSLISIGVAAALVAEPFVKSRAVKKRQTQAAEKKRDEYRKRAEYNREHLPPKELPSLSPDWAAVNKLFIETRFRLLDGGDVFLHHDFDLGTRRILKSDFNADTLKIIVMVQTDVNWFYAHPTGVTVGECGADLESFLREKYHGLSEDCISRVPYAFCINDR